MHYNHAEIPLATRLKFTVNLTVVKILPYLVHFAIKVLDLRPNLTFERDRIHICHLSNNDSYQKVTAVNTKHLSNWQFWKIWHPWKFLLIESPTHSHSIPIVTNTSTVSLYKISFMHINSTPLFSLYLIGKRNRHHIKNILLSVFWPMILKISLELSIVEKRQEVSSVNHLNNELFSLDK